MKFPAIDEYLKEREMIREHPKLVARIAELEAGLSAAKENLAAIAPHWFQLRTQSANQLDRIVEMEKEADIDRANLSLQRERITELESLFVLRPASEYREEYAAALWWDMPITSYPSVEYGIPQDEELTHFSLLPDPRKMTASDGVKVSPE